MCWFLASRISLPSPSRTNSTYKHSFRSISIEARGQNYRSKLPNFLLSLISTLFSSYPVFCTVFLHIRQQLHHFLFLLPCYPCLIYRNALQCNFVKIPFLINRFLTKFSISCPFRFVIEFASAAHVWPAYQLVHYCIKKFTIKHFCCAKYVLISLDLSCKKADLLFWL